MTAPAIVDILQDDALLICAPITGGVRDFEMACNHQVVSQLMRQTLLTQVGSINFALEFGFDWKSYLAFDAEYQFLQSDLTAAMAAVYGVASVDLAGAAFETQPELEVGPLCWTTDCANSKTCESLSI